MNAVLEGHTTHVGQSGYSESQLTMRISILSICRSLFVSGGGRRLVIEGQGSSQRHPDRPLIAMVARAHAYLEAHTDGQGFGRRMSPYIVETILTGQQPADLSVRYLARNIDLSISWAEQGRLLGV